MKTLTECLNGTRGKIASLEKNERFLNRVIAMGLTINCPVEVIQNKGKLPLLIYARDSMISLARNEAEKIKIEEV